MEFHITIFRLLHLIGLGLLLGSTICSVILVRAEKKSSDSARLAWKCMHLVAAPGLMLLLITGILQSSALYWAHFKGAGYMHAKIMLAVILLVMMIFDMRTQQKIIKSSPATAVVVNLLKRRQAYAITICLLTLVIMWMVSFRPF